VDRTERRQSFSQRAAQYVAQQRSKRGLSSGYSLSLRINARFKPPKNVPATFRFVRGEYTDLEGRISDYFPYYLHWSARTDRGFNCSKTWSMEPDGSIVAVGGKCLGCDEMEAEKENREKKTVDRRLMNAFSGIHLAWYHEVQATDKQGNELTYSKGEREGEPIMERQPCKGRVCDLCKQKAPRVFGKRVHTSMGMGHFESLSGFATEIERTCICGGRLNIVSFNCLKCGVVLLDLLDADMTDEQIVKYSQTPQQCECGNTDLPMPETECDNCSKPRPLSLYDVDVDIKRQGEGMKSTLQLTRWVYKELTDELKELAEPLPLDRIFGPDPFDYQAKCLKVRNPYASEKEKGAEEHAEGYDEQPDPEANPEEALPF